MSLEEVEVQIPDYDTTFIISKPRDIGEVRDEFGLLQVWCDVWPSGVALAGIVLAQREHFFGKRVLEIGSGVGVTACAALLAGAEVTILDYDQKALDIATKNCLTNTGRAPETIQCNWRDQYVLGDFDIILAADVLYEEDDIFPLSRLIFMALPEDGEIFIADPGREFVWEKLVKAWHLRGWKVSVLKFLSPIPDPHEGTKDIITIFRLRRSG